MPDPVPQAEPRFKVAEVLHFGGETTVVGLTPEMQQAKDKTAELRKERANNPSDGKNFLESYKNRPSEKNLTAQNTEDLNLRFGAGEAKREPPITGKIEVPDQKKHPEEAVLYTEAQTEIGNINKFLQYSEIMAEVKKTGKTIPTILGEKAIDPVDFDKQRGEVLDYLINAEVIQKGLPELATITNPDDRRKLIEETLAADPALRKKIVEKMVSIAERLKALPEAPVSKEVEDANDNKAETQTKITENLDLIRDKLKELGIDDVAAVVLVKDVEKYIKDGKSLDQVLSYLRSESSSRLLTNIPAINEYIKASNAIDTLQRKLDGLDVTKALASVVKAAEDQLASAQKIIDAFETDTGLTAELENYQNITRIFTNQKDNSSSTAEGGIYLSPVAHGIDQIVKSQKTIITADKIIEEKGEQSKKEQDAWRIDRLLKESNLISEMQNIIPSSIAEVLSSRYDEMVTLETTRMGKVAKEEEEKGNKAVADGIKKVEDAKGKNWIEYKYDPIARTRDKEVHTKALGDDIKYAAYGGEDAIRRLILRDSGLPLTDASGAMLMDARGTPYTWKTVDFSKLPEDRLKVFEQILEKAKSPYEQKLFGDFFLGKNFANRTIFGMQLGELALKKHEYELLQRNFSESFEKGINSKAEAKVAMEKLKKSGVKMNGGLLFLLGLMIAAPFMGAKKALGVGE